MSNAAAETMRASLENFTVEDLLEFKDHLATIGFTVQFVPTERRPEDDVYTVEEV